MPSIICIAHGKSGTTFLDHVFRHRTNVPAPLDDKEIKYFHDPAPTLEGYARHFGLTAADLADTERLTFEASPPYVTNQRRSWIDDTLRRIRDTLADPRIIIAIRNPVDWAVSQYGQTLYEVSQRGFPPRYRDLVINERGYPQTVALKDQITGKPFSGSIDDALGDQDLCHSSYTDAYELALKYFGPERIMFFCMERDCRNFPNFLDRLKAYFGVEFDYSAEPLDPALPGRGVPYYVYGGENGMTAVVDGIRCTLAPQQLLIVRSHPALVLDHVTAEEYERLEAARENWTKGLTADEAQALYDRHLKADFERFLELADQHYYDPAALAPYHHLTFRDKVIAPSRFEGDVADLFARGGSLEALA